MALQQLLVVEGVGLLAVEFLVVEDGFGIVALLEILGGQLFVRSGLCVRTIQSEERQDHEKKDADAHRGLLRSMIVSMSRLSTNGCRSRTRWVVW